MKNNLGKIVGKCSWDKDKRLTEEETHYLIARTLFMYENSEIEKDISNESLKGRIILCKANKSYSSVSYRAEVCKEKLEGSIIIGIQIYNKLRDINLN